MTDTTVILEIYFQQSHGCFKILLNLTYQQLEHQMNPNYPARPVETEYVITPAQSKVVSVYLDLNAAMGYMKSLATDKIAFCLTTRAH